VVMMVEIVIGFLQQGLRDADMSLLRSLGTRKLRITITQVVIHFFFTDQFKCISISLLNY